MDKTVTMSTKELSRLEVMQRLKDKRLLQKEAAIMLDISIRQIKRLWQKYQKQGAKGLISQRRGKASNHGLDAGISQQALDLIKKKYSDFGPTLAHEKLTEVHKVRMSRESVRKLMIAEGLWKPRRAKKTVVHQMRERRACLGGNSRVRSSKLSAIFVFLCMKIRQVKCICLRPAAVMEAAATIAQKRISSHSKCANRYH